MARVLVVHPDINFCGGAETVGAYTVQALSHDHEVTLVTWAEPDRERLDALFGTALASARFETITARHRVRAPDLITRRFLFQHAVGARFARSLLDGCDLVVGTHGELATPAPTIQYIHHPVYSSRVPQEVLTGVRPGLPERLLRRAARAAARLIAGGTRTGLARSLTLTNSDYMAAWLRRTWGLAPRVLWPPIPLASTPAVPWEQRESGVVCVGRLGPGKHVLELIRAVEEAQRLGADLHLHVVGAGSGPYFEAVRDACRTSRHASYEGVLSLPDLSRLLGTHRYGVHGFPHEHFGISLAQMVRAGCIAFAPNGGAPTQLFAATPYLLFDSFQELASHLAHVAGDAKLQAQLRIDLEPLREAFDHHHFGEKMAAVARARLAGQGQPALSLTA